MSTPGPWQPIVPAGGWTDPSHRKAYRNAYEHGYRRLVDSEPVRQHLARLMEHDHIGLDTLAQALDLNRATLIKILRCQRRRVYRETAEAILSFRPHDADRVANGLLVDSKATRLRIRALQALGYTETWIAQSIGRCGSSIVFGAHIRRDKALQVLELCRRIGNEPGPSTRARSRARRHGWPPPSAYPAERFYSEHWRPR